MSRAASSDRVEVPPDAFLRTTGQLWKVVIAAVVLPLPTAAFGWWSLMRIRPEQSTEEALASIGALVLAAAIIAALLLSIRCPGCRTRLVRRVFTASDGHNAILDFLASPVCHACGHDPRGGPHPGY